LSAENTQLRPLVPGFGPVVTDLLLGGEL